MSRIDDLIQEMCPDGVATMPLGSLLNYEQPGKYLVASTDYRDEHPTPVLTAGQTFVLGRTNETGGIYPASQGQPVLIFDDFTTAFRWVDFPFKAKSSAMKMLSLKPDAPALLRYVYFAMQCIGYRPQDHARHWIGKYSLFPIPVPPLEVQREIVRVLDKFTQLEAELEAELEARRAQYGHYRHVLLGLAGDRPLAAIADLIHGVSSGRNKSRVEGGVYPVFGSTGQIGSTDQPAYKADALLVARVGANAGRVNAVGGEYDVSDNTLIVSPNGEWDLRFAYHQLTHMHLNQYAVGGGQPLVTGRLLKSLEVAVPPLDEQRRIASVLDRFDALVNDISVGLPAELAARRKQYEHYRDRLLTFREIE